MHTMIDIEQAAKRFSEARTALASLVTELDDEIATVKKARLTAIKHAVARASERHDTLYALIDESKSLFEKPKSRVLHGVKVGFKKKPGAINIADEEATIRRIKKMFSDDEQMLAVLIKTKETPSKDALGELSADQLKKLGVAIANDSDMVVIKPVDSEVDKIVDALMDDATEGV
jgi:arsenate reductase-like glutaredoxin family protein